MKIRHFLLLALMPIIQIVYGGFVTYWAVPSFPKPEAPKALDSFIATQPSELESTGWLVASGNELKRYKISYDTLLDFGTIQSKIILLSGFSQVLFLISFAYIQNQKKKLDQAIRV